MPKYPCTTLADLLTIPVEHRARAFSTLPDALELAEEQSGRLEELTWVDRGPRSHSWMITLRVTG